MPNDQQKERASSSVRLILAWVAGLGTCLVLLMASRAFGPSGFLFGLVIAICAFYLMATRYRFRLRTLLIATTLFGVWLGLKVGRDLKLQQAISTVTTAGGQLELHDRRANFPWGVWSNRYRLDFHRLPQPLTKQQLAHLEGFAPSSLSHLYLTNSGLSDDAVKFVARLRNLESLSLGNETYATGELLPGRPHNQITDAALEHIQGLKSLTNIDLGGTDITDKCVTYLLQMPHLRCIYLSGTNVTGSEMSRLGALDNLWLLELNGCPISADGYKELGTLQNVRSLALMNVGMTDADLEKLNEMRQLASLVLRKNDISKEALKRFSEAHPSCRIQRLGN